MLWNKEADRTILYSPPYRNTDLLSLIFVFM